MIIKKTKIKKTDIIIKKFLKNLFLERFAKSIYTGNPSWVILLFSSIYIPIPLQTLHKSLISPDRIPHPEHVGHSFILFLLMMFIKI